MAREDVFHRVFYDGSVRDARAFLELMQKPANVPVFVFEGAEPLGFAWLNGLNGGIAFAHFCGLKAAKGRTQQLGRLCIGYWMKNFQFLRVILGLTPSNNKLAVRFIQRLGFTPLGEIPGVVHDAYSGERVGAVISYYARA